MLTQFTFQPDQSRKMANQAWDQVFKCGVYAVDVGSSAFNWAATQSKGLKGYVDLSQTWRSPTFKLKPEQEVCIIQVFVSKL